MLEEKMAAVVGATPHPPFGHPLSQGARALGLDLVWNTGTRLALDLPRP